MSKITPDSVGSAYENFLGIFRIAAEDANREMKEPDRPTRSCFRDLGNNTAIFERCMYLRGWPSRRLGTNKRLDIVIKACETFKTPEWLLTKSTVYLNYFVVAESRGKLAQSLHF